MDFNIHTFTQTKIVKTPLAMLPAGTALWVALLLRIHNGADGLTLGEVERGSTTNSLGNS